jgi:hypothetical protein
MASPRKEAVPASTTASRRLVRRRARAPVRRFAALRRTWCPRRARAGPVLLHPARWCRPSGRGGAAPPFCPPSPPRPRPWHSPPPAPGRRRAGMVSSTLNLFLWFPRFTFFF